MVYDDDDAQNLVDYEDSDDENNNNSHHPNQGPQTPADADAANPETTTTAPSEVPRDDDAVIKSSPTTGTDATTTATATTTTTTTTSIPATSHDTAVATNNDSDSEGAVPEDDNDRTTTPPGTPPPHRRRHNHRRHSSSSSSSRSVSPPSKNEKRSRSPRPSRHGSRRGRRDDSSKETKPTSRRGGRDTAPTPPPPPPPVITPHIPNDTGVYIPPHKRHLLLPPSTDAAADPSSRAVQRASWDNLRKSINGVINRLSPATLKPLIASLFSHNLLRGRGLLAKSLLKAVVASPPHIPVYASLVSVVNTKLPEVGELILHRAILTFRRFYARRDKAGASSLARFLGCLFNQGVVYELLPLQMLTLLLDGDPNDDSVEIAVGFLTVIGRVLGECSPRGLEAVMERSRALLHEGALSRRLQQMVEELFLVRRRGFPEGVPAELDLVEEEDQICFEVGLDDEDLRSENELDVFRFDDKYEEGEKVWDGIRREVLGDGDDGDGSSSDEEGSSGEASTASSSSSEAEEMSNAIVPLNNTQDKQVITDLSESNLIHLRRTIYLTIMSSASFEECAHKLAKTSIPVGHEHELINMIIECCSQERTSLRYYSLIAQRFCLLEDRWREAFQVSFQEQYTTIHRLETNKLRNVAKLFAHLLFTDAMSWIVFRDIKLNEDETTSSSRIFVKILVQEMAETLGVLKLKARFEEGLTVKDNNGDSALDGMFPMTDNPRHTRYAINFFTSIGLGPLTDGMREWLKNAPKLILERAAMEQRAAAAAESSSSTDESSSVSSSSVSSTSSSSVTTSSSSRSRGRRRRRRRSPSSSYTSHSSYSSRSSYSTRSRSRSRSLSRSPSRSRRPDDFSRSPSQDEFGRCRPPQQRRQPPQRDVVSPERMVPSDERRNRRQRDYPDARPLPPEQSRTRHNERTRRDTPQRDRRRQRREHSDRRMLERSRSRSRDSDTRNSVNNTSSSNRRRRRESPRTVRRSYSRSRDERRINNDNGRRLSSNGTESSRSAERPSKRRRQRKQRPSRRSRSSSQSPDRKDRSRSRSRTPPDIKDKIIEKTRNRSASRSPIGRRRLPPSRSHSRERYDRGAVDRSRSRGRRQRRRDSDSESERARSRSRTNPDQRVL